MTDKQVKIIDKAIDLFILRGYFGTTTKQISLDAQVSEGLIFKHFKNKEGLLLAVHRFIDEQISEDLKDIMFEENPKQLLRSTLNYTIMKADAKLKFWHLNFKLNRELPNYQSECIHKLDAKILKAFVDLNYKQPRIETSIFINLLDFCFTQCYFGLVKDKRAFLSLINNKYYLQ